MLVHADEGEPLDSKFDSGGTSNMDEPNEKKEMRRTMAKAFLGIF